MQPNSEPNKKYDYHEEKTKYQKELEAWEAEQAALPPIEMTEEDYRLAMEMYGPLFPFHPSPFSNFASLN